VATFAYTALEPSGKKKTGYVDASDKDAAIASIAVTGRFVVEIREQAAISGKEAAQASGKKGGKISKSEIAMFTRRMADLASAGLPLDRVLQVVGEQSESAGLTDIAEQALNDVRTGMPVSAALAKHPKQFPQVYTETLRSGEASGQFGQVATRLADFQEQEVARRGQVVAALIYPILLTCTAIFVIIFLLTFVVPKLSGVFEGLGKDLPLPTVVLFTITNFLTKFGVEIIVGLIALFIFMRYYLKTEAGAMAKDKFMVRIPVIGPVIYKAVVARFARVLGTLVYGGVPILDALELAGLASGNRVFLERSKVVGLEVREGRPIAEAMRDAGEFPAVLTHMVAIGEETGDLPKMLGRVSDSLDFEVENGMRKVTSLVEPVIVLSMGIFVGFVVLSVLLPIFQANELVK
jgi:type II secretory pathway component PulF